MAAEDEASAGGESGAVVLAVRNDTAATKTSADGDFTALAADAAGRLGITDLGGSITVDGTVSVTSGGLALLDGVSGSIKATVLDYTNSNPLAVRLTNTDGDYVSAGAGTQYTEDAAAAADPVGNAVILVRKDTLAALTSADGDNVAARGTDKGELYVKHVDSVAVTGTITASNASGDVAHDSADSGNPVKVGGRAANALPTPVASADRANVLTDLWGRVLQARVDPGMQVWKSYNTTSQATGATIWDPTSGKKIAITAVVVGTYGTTAGRLILWFGANGDTTYSAGTDQPVLVASFAPSATVKPGAILVPSADIFCVTADHELHITTDAALSVDVTVYGYEW